MSEKSAARKTSPVSARAMAVAIVFGGVALIIVLADMTIPIPGTKAMSDPRELFTTLGAALSGPIGGVLIGILAGVAMPKFPLISIFAHIVGGVWMGFAYKKLVYSHLRTLTGLLGWAGIVLAYYYLFLMPGFTIGLFYGAGLAFLPTYTSIAIGALPEALLTTCITIVVILALPARYRRPLW